MKWGSALAATLILAAAGGALAQPPAGPSGPSPAAPPAPLADGVLALEEAWQLAEEHSFTLAAARKRSQAAGQLRQAAAAGLLPSLDVSASYSRLSEVDSVAIDLGGEEPLAIEQYESSVNLGFTIEQPVFVPALAAALRQSRQLAVAARQAERLSRADLRVLLEETYNGELAARAMQTAAEDALAAVRAHRRLVGLMEEVGLATRLDAAQVETRLAELEVTQIQVASAVRLARLALVILTDLAPESVFELEPPPPAAAPPVEGADLIALALASRPDLLALEASARAVRAEAGIAASGLLPNVAFRFGYQYDRPNQRAFPPQDEFMDSWDATIGLSWRLWDFGAVYNRARAARSQAEAVRYDLAAARDGVRLDVYQKRVTLAESQARLAAAGRAQAAGAEALRVARERYEVGDAPNTDVLDAQMTYTQAQFQVIRAETDIRLAWTRLQRAIGIVP